MHQKCIEVQEWKSERESERERERERERGGEREEGGIYPIRAYVNEFY